MIDLFLYYWWIPLIYLGLGLILIGGCFFPIWNKLMDKLDGKIISDKDYLRLKRFLLVTGIFLLGLSWYLIMMRKIVGMHPFIIGTFMIQPFGQSLFILSFLMQGKKLRTGTLIGYFLVILYACLGMIVIHDLFWCARRTDWYTHSWPAGDDLILYAVLTGGPYDYLIFGEVMVLQLILLVGASISVLYVLEKRLKKTPDDFNPSSLRQNIFALLLFYLALFGFAISVDIIDDIKFYGDLQYTLALHIYLPVFTLIAMVGFFIYKKHPIENSDRIFYIYVITGILFIKSIIFLITSIQLSYLVGVPNFQNLYQTITSLFNLPWIYSSMVIIFSIDLVIYGIVLFIVHFLRKRILRK